MIYKAVVTGLICAASAFAQSNDLDVAFSELQRVWRAGDGVAAEKLFSGELSFITRTGMALKRQELLSGFRPASGTMDNIAEKKIQIFGDVAVITFKDGEGDSAARRTIVWHKSREGWKVVSMLTTPIKP